MFNSICAASILGESFTRWSLGGTILVSTGAVLIATFGAIGEPAHSLNQLLELLGRQQFVLWMIGQAILIVAIIIGVRALEVISLRSINSPRMRLLRGMAYGCISGILSAHSLLIAKSAVELLVRTITDRRNQFNRWQSWLILLSLLSLALSQLYYLHRGLKLCSTSILYPFVFCVYNIIAILDGLIYFHQTSRLSVLSACMVCVSPLHIWQNAWLTFLPQITLGTIILLAGVLALSWRLSNDTPRTYIGQTPLTPGMGLVSDDSDSEIEADFLPDDDQESQMNSMNSPLLDSKSGESSNANRRRFHNSQTPTSKNNDLLGATRARRIGLTEANEIWGELEDSKPDPLSSPFSQRRSSARSTPSNVRQVGETGHGVPPSESTALLERSNTGRSYKDRRRRRSVPLGDGSTRERKRSGLQNALGGWWKLAWWRVRSGEDGRKGKGVDGRPIEGWKDVRTWKKICESVLFWKHGDGAEGLNG